MPLGPRNWVQSCAGVFTLNVTASIEASNCGTTSLFLSTEGVWAIVVESFQNSFIHDEHVANLLFNVVGRAYEPSSLLLTTKLSLEKWTEVMGSELLTGAMLDRLTLWVQILDANGPSYRLQDAKAQLKRR